MSVYINISKRLGFEPCKLDYPTLLEVQALRAQIKSEACFEKVFRYYRFLHSAETKDQIEVMDEICAAFKEGQAIHSKD